MHFLGRWNSRFRNAGVIPKLRKIRGVIALAGNDLPAKSQSKKNRDRSDGNRAGLLDSSRRPWLSIAGVEDLRLAFTIGIDARTSCGDEPGGSFH